MLLAGREHIALGQWDEAEAVLALLLGTVERSRAAPAWAWIAVARIGRGDPRGAREARRRASLALDREQPVAAYALRLTEGTSTTFRPVPE